MTKWQDIFELVEVCQYEHGGFMRIGGDPETYSNPIVYKIASIKTGDFVDGMCPMSRYTAEYYANKTFEELESKVEHILTE